MTDQLDSDYVCPLCSHPFHGAGCHAACGMSSGCAKVRCPQCAYEFVEEGTIANMLRKLFGLRSPGGAA